MPRAQEINSAHEGQKRVKWNRQGSKLRVNPQSGPAEKVFQLEFRGEKLRIEYIYVEGSVSTKV